ncbi:MAG: phospholipase D-like domain-containing protein [Pirellulaceae bacterium]
MLADIELLISPYASEKRSLLHVLISELRKPDWDHFQAAVAFAKSSGNKLELFDSMKEFAQRGGRIDLTFGADRFSGDGSGSEYLAVQEVLARLGEERSVNVFLYHECGRTFHPKIYLFSNEADNRALVIVGSSNWTNGGFHNNVEANVVLRLNLRTSAHRRCFDEIRTCFQKYWVEK